ncbi:hypothetical protein DAPPUDRAFT_236927 [Daphnia pulex]|uniref:Uncharacterized protein n=1 Tax=Daphnia pulex TaxID=6669 RepID=E9G2A5_DAPPU|nr:hypothetical protein DAPPUDRAFT_236927 [Daphnia pulex]|eukprot:EFX86210.1 hypothetical protein DAPPUDRAFT_236927 [Daphnia pulex]
MDALFAGHHPLVYSKVSSQQQQQTKLGKKKKKKEMLSRSQRGKKERETPGLLLEIELEGVWIGLLATTKYTKRLTVMLGPQQPNTTTTNLSVASPVDY